MGRFLTLNRILRFKSVRNKFFAITFVATHVPLISFVIYLFIQKSFTASFTEWLILLVSTLAGTAFAFWSIQQLLKPVNYSVDALDNYLHKRQLTDLPYFINDEMSQLMRSISYTLETLDRRYKDLETVFSYDFLTDLHNRRSAKAKLNNHLNLCDTESSRPFIIMIDLDRFKTINDTYGHFAGDVILQDLAEEIKSCFITPDDWVARWGGDEFLLVLHGNESSVSNQLRILQKISQKNSCLLKITY